MASENQVGIDFAARDSGFVSVMQQMIEATQQLTTTITGLNNILASNSNAVNVLEQAHQKSAASTSADVAATQALANAESTAGAASQTRLAQLMQEVDQRERLSAVRQQLAASASEETNSAQQEGAAVQELTIHFGNVTEVINKATGEIISSTAAQQASTEGMQRGAVATAEETQAMIAAGTAAQVLAESTAALGAATEAMVPAVEYLSQSWEKVFMTLGKLGDTAPQAIAQINTYVAEGIAPQQAYIALLQERFNLIQGMAAEGATYLEINAALKQLDQTTSMYTGNSRQQTTEMRGARFEVMSLMMIMMEFNTVLQGNTKDMQVAREGVMAMANALMVVAMVPDLAPLALLTAAIAGVAIAAKALQDLDIEALNKELDSLGKKEDASAGLMKLAGVEKDVADNALLWMKAMPEAADALKKLEEEGKTAIPVLQGVGDALRQAGDNAGMFIELIEIISAGVIAIAAAEKDGKTFQEALTEAQKAGREALRGYSDEAYAAIQMQVQEDAASQKITDAYKEQEAAVKSLTGTKDIATTMIAQMTNLSLEDSAAVLKAAKSYSDLGIELETDATRVVALQKEIALLEAQGNTPSELAGLFSQLGIALDATRASAQALRDAMAFDEAAANIKKLAEDEVKALADIAKAQRDTDVSREQSRRQLSDQLQQLAFQDATAEIKYQQDIAKANRTLNDSLADDAQKLADANFKAQQSLADELSNLDYQHQKQMQDISNQIVTAQITAANDIAKAYRDMLQALANEDWNTHNNLQNAKTENAKEQVLSQAAHERAVTRDKFSNVLEDANNRIAEEQRVAAIKAQLADQDLQHSIDVAQRKYSEELANAQRAYNEEVASAQRRNQEQLADLAQSLANEERLMAHQRDVAEQNNIQRIADLDARLAREISDIQARYAAEQQAIMDTASLAVSAYMQIQQAIEAINMVMSLGLAGNPDVLALNLPSRDTGGSVTAGQPYYIGVPEIFTPTQNGVMAPLSQSSTTYGGHTITIQVNGARDPAATAEEVRRVLEQEVWRT